MHRIFCFTGLALLALGVSAACSSGSNETALATSEPSVTSTTTADDNAPADGDATETRAPNVSVPPPPDYISLTPLTTVAAPGDTVIVEADDDPAAPLHLIGATGIELETGWAGNRATLELPGSIDAGLYLVQLEGQPSFATLRVVEDRAINLATDRTYVTSQDGATLHVSSALPADDLIAWLVVETDEVGLGGVPVEQYFSPTTTGALAALEPKPLAEFLDRPLRLPTGVAGAMRIMAGTKQTFLEEDGIDEYESNRISIETCDVGSTLTGISAGPALVRAVWADSSLRSSAVSVDGDYSIRTGAGPVLVSIVNLETDGAPAPRYFAVDAPCGGTINVDSVAAAGPPTEGNTTPEAAPAAATGPSGSACRTVYVSPITIEGRDDDWGPYVAAEIARALPNATVISQWDADQITRFEALRNALDAGDDELMRRLGETVGTADFVVSGSVKDQLGEASIGLIALHRRPTDVDATGYWSGGPFDTALFDHAVPELIENLQTSAICGTITPEKSSIESDETVELTYEVTDLAGAPADGAAVSISESRLGTLDPAGGSIDGGAFVTTFTPNDGASGSQGLEFSAQWDGPAGNVRTREDEAWTTILIDADWRIHMEASEPQADLGPDGYARFTWDGEFTVDADGVIEGSGTGVVEVGGSCVVDGAPVEGPFNIPGSFTFNISGERTYSETPDFVLGFTGTLFRIGDPQPAPVSGPCQFLVALGQGFGSELMRVIAYHPHYLPIEGEGSLTLPAAAGTTSFETWSGPPLVVTLEDVVYE